MSIRMEQLQTTIVELGAEVYKLRYELKDLLHAQGRIHQTLRGIKAILDDKGVISIDEFETMVELQHFMDTPDHQEQLVPDTTRSAAKKDLN